LVDQDPAFAGHPGSAANLDRARSILEERDVTARLDAGAIVDEVTTSDGHIVSVRYERCPAGWQAAFELSHPEVDDLAVVHRLVTDTLAEAKASVPPAISFLMGTPIDRPI
jgi:hypothetical protein